MLKKSTLKNKLISAYSQDKEILTSQDQMDKTFGHNPQYLLDIHGITKSDLIRLERLGLAIKARYETRHPKAEFYEKINEKRKELGLDPVVCKSGVHKVRWIIKEEALDEKPENKDKPKTHGRRFGYRSVVPSGLGKTGT